MHEDMRFCFNHLPKDVQREVIQREAEREPFFDMHEHVYEDFIEVAAILGVSVREEDIYYSGFCSQGDGACFSGYYRYAKNSRQKIREHAPRDEELHAIADSLYQVQRRRLFSATASITTSGRYYHSGTMSVSGCWRHGDLFYDEEMALLRLLRRLADWLYDQLEKEYTYYTSDEYIRERLEGEGCVFTCEGERD